MRSAIYRLNKSSLHLAEIGFVDPVFGKKNFKNKYGRKCVGRNFSKVARVSASTITASDIFFPSINH